MHSGITPLATATRSFQDRNSVVCIRIKEIVGENFSASALEHSCPGSVFEARYDSLVAFGENARVY